MAYLLGFNNNIRCIEMRLARGDTVDQGTFNNNEILK